MHVLPESITALALNNPVVHVFAKQHQAGLITVEAALEGMVMALASMGDRALDEMLGAEANRPIEIVVTFDSLPPEVQAKVRGDVRLVAPQAKDTPGPRPVVKRFAAHMEAVLRANDHKTGWLDMSREALMTRLGEEVEELAEAHRNGDAPEIVMREAVDVANFAMMIADVSLWHMGNWHTPVAPKAPRNDEPLGPHDPLWWM